jgi:hypothetical protein
MEGFEVGLDARASAGIGSGDGEGDGEHDFTVAKRGELSPSAKPPAGAGLSNL